MRGYINLGYSILKSNFVRPSLPYKLSFILTYKCNFRCTICNIWKKRSENEMTCSEIEQFFKNNSHISWLNLGGGEMFLRPDLTQIIDIIYENLPHLVLLDFPTTGFFTDKIIALVDHIQRYKPRKCIVTISIDGPPGLHDETRGIKGSWDRAISTFRELRKFNNSSFKCYLGHTLSEYNYKFFDQTVDSVREKISDVKNSEFHINLAQSSEFYYQNTSSLKKDWTAVNKDKIMGLLTKISNSKRGENLVISYLEKTYQKNLNRFLESAKTPMRCQALSASCFIDPYWDVYPCITYNKVVANLKNYNFDLSQIWSLDSTSELLGKIDSYACPNCWTPCEAYQTIFGNLLRVKNKS